MPSEPKKPIEPLLEASAKARRAAFGQDPTMPNPMRARLHDEISRLERERESEPRRSWLLMFWPRVTVAAALATLLVLVPMMWWRGSSTGPRGAMQVASRGSDAANEMREAAAPLDETLAKGPAAAGAAAPNVNLADNSRAKLAPEQTPASAADDLDQSKTVAKTDTTAAVSSQMMKGFITKEEKSAETEPHASMAQPGAPAANPPVSGKDEVAAARSMTRAADSGATVQQFAQQQGSQVFRNNVQVRQAANVLNSFQVQQAGSEIRVVDSDGSTYTGKLEPLAAKTARVAAKRSQSYELRATAERDNKAQVAESRFRATGYNVSLKKPLVFEGNYTMPTQEQQQQQNLTNNVSPRAENPERARIVGTAQVHGEKPVQVDATEVSTPTEKSER